jgi:hypothetical protein
VKQKTYKEYIISTTWLPKTNNFLVSIPNLTSETFIASSQEEGFSKGRDYIDLREVVSLKELAPLIESLDRPCLTKFVEFARSRNITASKPFWDLFETIQELWATRHCKEPDCE